jgi:hypothetical protein
VFVLLVLLVEQPGQQELPGREVTAAVPRRPDEVDPGDERISSGSRNSIRVSFRPRRIAPANM